MADSLASEFEKKLNVSDSSLSKKQKKYLDIERNLASDLEDKYEVIIKEGGNKYSFIDRKLNPKNPENVVVSNPFDYAFDFHVDFVNEFLPEERVKILFLGMNSSLTGTEGIGIPFGDIPKVKEYLKMTNNHDFPQKIKGLTMKGLDDTTSNISGRRFWGFIEKAFDLQYFKKHCFVRNYCPLFYTGYKETNIPLSDIENKKKIAEPCNQALLEIIDLLGIEIIITFGDDVYDMVIEIEKSQKANVRVKKLMHPSPRNNRVFAKNKGFIDYATKKFIEHLIDMALAQ